MVTTQLQEQTVWYQARIGLVMSALTECIVSNYKQVTNLFEC